MLTLSFCLVNYVKLLDSIFKNLAVFVVEGGVVSEEPAADLDGAIHPLLIVFPFTVMNR